MHNDQYSLGFVETAGLVTAMIVADAMAKAAEVTITHAHKVDGLNVCVICRGDVASCKAAVDAGIAVAAGRNRLLCSNVIARPTDEDPGVAELLAGIVAKESARKTKKLARRKALAACAQPEESPAPVAAAPQETAPESDIPATETSATESERLEIKTESENASASPENAVPANEAPAESQQISPTSQTSQQHAETSEKSKKHKK